MKYCRIYKLLQVPVFLSIWGLFSCSDFLDQYPKSSFTEEYAFSDLSKIEPSVNGLYTTFRNTKEGREGLTFLMLGLDESKQGIVQVDGSPEQASLDRYNGMMSSTTQAISKMWSKKWTVVTPAAKAIHALSVLEDNTDEAHEDFDKIRRIKGEACFFRAMAMFELVMYWGEVPVVDIQTTTIMDRRPLTEVWGQIFADLTYAATYLPQVSAEKRRVTSGAAWSMLGKAYMCAHPETGLRDFSKAKACFWEVINSGVYDLDPSYANLFDENLEFNSPESVFEIDFENPWPLQNYWQFDLGSRTVDNAFGNGCYFSGYDVALPTEYCYKMKANGGIWEEGDLRKDEAIRYDFTYMGITLTVPSWGADELDPHIRKYEDFRTDMSLGTFNNMWYSGKNFIVIRYADVLLSYAECLNELDQTSDAISIVNNVRERAWGGSLPSQARWSGLSQSDFRKEILDERMRELCFEGWRRIDLLRTGNFINYVKERNTWAKQSGTMSDYHVRWPIPNDEINDNPDIDEEDQNPGFN